MRRLLIVALGGLAALVSPAYGAEPAPELACRFGAWRMEDGARLILAPSDSPNLRWRTREGETGKLWPAEGGGYEGGEGWSVHMPVTVRARLGACPDSAISFQRDGKAWRTGRRIKLSVKPVTFPSGPERLYGELVLPERGPPKAVVVLQYGSDPESAVLNNYVQYLLPLDGIGVFVFDKRGTGRSSGQFTANFATLAADMAAAVDAVRARPEARSVPLGLMGESQGGWVAPLAATLRNVDFVVASYSLAVSPAGEDRDEVAQSVAGYGPAAVEAAETLHRAATHVIESAFADGLDELEALKARYRSEPWFGKVGGDYTGPLVATPAAEMGKVRALFDRYLAGIDIDYAPQPVLAKLRTPTLFVLAGDDTEAPHEATLAVLRKLQAAGSPIDVAVFPDADHALIAVEGGPVDHAYLGHYAPGYFDLLADWIVHRRFGPTYGAAELLSRR